jgi:SNF2 family DNA or RNA helicase
MAVRPNKCKHCSKQFEILEEKNYPEIKLTILKLKCGHELTEVYSAPLFPPNRDAIWLKAYPYQREGVEFAEKANYNCLFADEPGLGKTIQALLAIRYHWEELTPCVITCKASLGYNWMREYFKWVLDCWTLEEEDELSKQQDGKWNEKTSKLPCYYTDGTVPLFAGFKVYIIPMSLLAREDVQKQLREVIKPKLIIGDEVHNFKNTRSQRTQALYDVLDGIERNKDGKIVKQWDKIPHRIMLSGTPVVNRLFEYFPVLNIIKPLHFSNIKQFAARWVDYDYNTKRWLGLKSSAKQAFFNMTSSYVIRRTRQVLNLPKRMPDAFVYTDDFTNKEYAKEYNKTLDQLEEVIESTKNNAGAGDMILGIMSHLRRLAGLLKVKSAISWAEELLENTDEKLLIGVHHKDVATYLMVALAKYNPIQISGDDNALQKDSKIELSKLPNHRVVVGNIEACGEGINGLQVSFNNVLVLERGWSPSREEQFIGRVDRPGQTLSVFVTFLIAARTLDDFFMELLKFKKNVVTDGTTLDFVLDRETMKQLARRCIDARIRIVGA